MSPVISLQTDGVRNERKGKNAYKQFLINSKLQLLNNFDYIVLYIVYCVTNISVYCGVDLESSSRINMRHLRSESNGI